MNYIPASELEKLILERRAPKLLGIPFSTHLNELCHAPFSSPAAATRAAMQHVETMNGGKPLPWYLDPSYASAQGICDSTELRASIFCFPCPQFPHPSEQAKNPEMVCGYTACIVICAWAPPTLAERAPQNPDLYAALEEAVKRLEIQMLGHSTDHPGAIACRKGREVLAQARGEASNGS